MKAVNTTKTEDEETVKRKSIHLHTITSSASLIKFAALSSSSALIRLLKPKEKQLVLFLWTTSYTREENFTSKAVTFLARSKYSTVQVLKDALKDRFLNDEVNVGLSLISLFYSHSNLFMKEKQFEASTLVWVIIVFWE